jgi:DNA-damage-inducible protein J
MAENAVVRARVSEEVKQEAAEVLAEMGLTVSDLMRMTLTRVARDHALPFHPEHIPNDETAETLRKSRRGEELHEFENMDEMFKKLGI